MELFLRDVATKLAVALHKRYTAKGTHIAQPKPQDDMYIYPISLTLCPVLYDKMCYKPNTA